MLTKLVLNTMIFTLFHVCVFKMFALLIKLVDLLFFVRTTYLKKINFHHLIDKILNINLPQDNFVNLCSFFFVFNVYNCEENITAGEQIFELCLGFLMDS